MKTNKAVMKRIKSVGHFVNNGFSVLRDASVGSYGRKSDIIEELRKEMMDVSPRTISDDKKNLIGDRKALSKDIRKAYVEIVTHNG
jgi:hypothetical protein